MTKFRAPLIFYAIAFTVIYLLFRVSPGQHDGAACTSGSTVLSHDIYNDSSKYCVAMNIYRGDSYP